MNQAELFRRLHATAVVWRKRHNRRQQSGGSEEVKISFRSGYESHASLSMRKLEQTASDLGRALAFIEVLSGTVVKGSYVAFFPTLSIHYGDLSGPMCAYGWGCRLWDGIHLDKESQIQAIIDGLPLVPRAIDGALATFRVLQRKLDSVPPNSPHAP